MVTVRVNWFLSSSFCLRQLVSIRDDWFLYVTIGILFTQLVSIPEALTWNEVCNWRGIGK